MVLVGARAHLSHDLRTCCHVIRLCQAIAQVLHATDTIYNVVLCVNSASHVARIRRDAL